MIAALSRMPGVGLGLGYTLFSDQLGGLIGVTVDEVLTAPYAQASERLGTLGEVLDRSGATISAADACVGNTAAQWAGAAATAARHRGHGVLSSAQGAQADLEHARGAAAAAMEVLATVQAVFHATVTAARAVGYEVSPAGSVTPSMTQLGAIALTGLAAPKVAAAVMQISTALTIAVQAMLATIRAIDAALGVAINAMTATLDAPAAEVSDTAFRLPTTPQLSPVPAPGPAPTPVAEPLSAPAPASPASTPVAAPPLDDPRYGPVQVTGDLASADTIITLVSGVGSSDTRKYVDTQHWARSLHDEARAHGVNAAVIAWHDYPAPADLIAGASPSTAQEHAPRLAAFQEQLRALNPDATLRLLGHSYGSTLIGSAAAHTPGLAADDIIAWGSPGMGTDADTLSTLRNDRGEALPLTHRRLPGDIVGAVTPPGTGLHGPLPSHPGGVLGDAWSWWGSLGSLADAAIDSITPGRDPAAHSEYFWHPDYRAELWRDSTTAAEVH